MASAAILAGGQATRFGGRDKSALVVEGRRIIDRQIDELLQVTDDILIVGAARHADQGSNEWPAPVVRHVPDRIPDSGPLAGLDAALQAARDGVVLILGCDMPFVTAPLLAYLASLAGDRDAVVPRTKRGYHPLCAAYTRRCEAAVQRRLLARQLALVGLLDDVRVRVVERHEIEVFGDPDHLLCNVNTPADYTPIERPARYKR